MKNILVKLLKLTCKYLGGDFMHSQWCHMITLEFDCIAYNTDSGFMTITWFLAAFVVSMPWFYAHTFHVKHIFQMRINAEC